MAEFCPECYKRMYGEMPKGMQMVVSKELDLCEACGEWKPVIVRFRREWNLWRVLDWWMWWRRI